MRLYSELAHWWPLFSPPDHYAEEAAHLLRQLGGPADRRRTLLELGSGGGSMAFHLKAHFELTLTDLSPAMLAVSRAVNPEVEHLEGDMRTMDLGRRFDVVMIHDAICYLVDLDSLRAALATAANHCRSGGTVIVLPDYVRERFEAGTDVGGEDGRDGRALRYLEWRWDPDPGDSEYQVAYALLLREADGSLRTELDLQREGLFGREDWLASFRAVGLEPRSEIDPWNREVFLATPRP